MEFYNNLDSLDLHGETRDTIYTVLYDFIKDNLKLKNEIIVIVHGKGQGILKEEIHYYLKRMKEVKKYYLHYWNQGSTIVELRIE